MASVLAIAGTAAEASAQHCTALLPSDPRRLGLLIGASGEVVAYRAGGHEGAYQGIGLRFAWDHRWVRLRASISAYRNSRGEVAANGIGDLFLEVAVPFARTLSDGFIAGFVVSATIPTGSRAQGLGMGHVMLMPALWGTWRHDRLFLSGQVGYGKTLASEGGHDHHGGGWPPPVVNPMNPSEFEFAITGGFSIDRPLRLRAGAYAAAPVAVEDGAPRAAVLMAIDLALAGWLEFSVEGHLPIVGDPFHSKLVLTAGARL